MERKTIKQMINVFTMSAKLMSQTDGPCGACIAIGRAVVTLGYKLQLQTMCREYMEDLFKDNQALFWYSYSYHKATNQFKPDIDFCSGTEKVGLVEALCYYG